jgi:hypothetical protein
MADYLTAIVDRVRIAEGVIRMQGSKAEAVYATQWIRIASTLRKHISRVEGLEP